MLGYLWWYLESKKARGQEFNIRGDTSVVVMELGYALEIIARVKQLPLFRGANGNKNPTGDTLSEVWLATPRGLRARATV